MLKWDKWGTKPLENGHKMQKNGNITVPLLLNMLLSQKCKKKNVSVGTGSDPVPKNRFAIR